MFRLFRFFGLVALLLMGLHLTSPCTVQAQNGYYDDEPQECLNVDGYVPCDLPQCQYRCECQNNCDPLFSDPEPWCCGTDHDCVCEGWPITEPDDYHCTFGGYCCCHDTCCGQHGWSGFWCLISPCTWAWCYTGCTDYPGPNPDNCDTSGYPEEEPMECLNVDGYVPCDLAQCQYRCECQ
jgi:hypothetical protein